MSENDYLEQVMAKQQRVEVDLKARRASPAAHRQMANYNLAAPEPQQALAVAGLARARGSAPSIAVPDRQTEAKLRFLEARQRVANDTSQGNLHARLIEALPRIAENLPKPSELKAISIGSAGGGDGALAALAAQLLALVDGFRGSGAGRGQESWREPAAQNGVATATWSATSLPRSLDW